MLLSCDHGTIDAATTILGHQHIPVRHIGPPPLSRCVVASASQYCTGVEGSQVWVHLWEVGLLTDSAGFIYP